MLDAIRAGARGSVRRGLVAAGVVAVLGSALLAGSSAAAGTRAAASALAGTWGTAEEIPGTAELNQGGSAQISSVSCGSAGNCSAGGLYMDGSGHLQAFVAGESDGAWGTAQEAPGTAELNQGGVARHLLGVVRFGGQLQRRRDLRRCLRLHAGVCDW